MKKTTLLAMGASLLLSACGTETAPTHVTAVEDLGARALQLAQDNLIVDTHVDVPYRISRRPADVTQATEGGDFDYPRAVAGGLNAPFMSIYTPAELESLGESKQLAESLIALVEGIAEAGPDKFAIARSVAEVREQFEAGLISLPMGMENGSPIEGDLGNLEYFHDLGIRYITLTHGLSNHISDSSYDDNRQWNGLSEFGVDVVKEMNRLGIMIDISHVSDEAFWQVLEITETPVIASHSSARHFTPGFERNMNDEMIVALAENGGVIQINFGSTFISQKSRDYSDARSAAGKQFLLEHPDMTESELYTTFREIYAAEHGPMPFATLDDVLDHFDHVVALVGIDHVGIGSDYDGVGDSLPTGLKDVSAYPNLVEGLLKRGYSEDDVRKVLAENLLRVWQTVEDHAEQQT
jgi:membrane dipeptidase